MLELNFHDAKGKKIFSMNNLSQVASFFQYKIHLANASDLYLYLMDHHLRHNYNGVEYRLNKFDTKSGVITYDELV